MGWRSVYSRRRQAVASRIKRWRTGGDSVPRQRLSIARRRAALPPVRLRQSCRGAGRERIYGVAAFARRKTDRDDRTGLAAHLRVGGSFGAVGSHGAEKFAHLVHRWTNHRLDAARARRRSVQSRRGRCEFRRCANHCGNRRRCRSRALVPDNGEDRHLQAAICGWSMPRKRASIDWSKRATSGPSRWGGARWLGVHAPTRSSSRRRISTPSARQVSGFRCPARDAPSSGSLAPRPTSASTLDGHAVWVENDSLVARSRGRGGIARYADAVVPDAAVEARYAHDGTILYLSADGLRLRAPDGDVRRIGWPLRYRAAASAPSLLIHGARVIDGRGGQTSDPRDLLIENGRIARVAPVNTISAPGIAELTRAARIWSPGSSTSTRTFGTIYRCLRGFITE